MYRLQHRGKRHDLAAPDPAPLPGLRLTELTIISRWWMRVEPLSEAETIMVQGWQNGRSRSETGNTLIGHNGHLSCAEEVEALPGIFGHAVELCHKVDVTEQRVWHLGIESGIALRSTLTASVSCARPALH